MPSDALARGTSWINASALTGLAIASARLKAKTVTMATAIASTIATSFLRLVIPRPTGFYAALISVTLARPPSARKPDLAAYGVGPSPYPLPRGEGRVRVRPRTRRHDGRQRNDHHLPVARSPHGRYSQGAHGI